MAIAYAHVSGPGGSAPVAKPVYVDRVTFDVGGDNYATDGLACDLVGEIAELNGRTILAVLDGGNDAGLRAEYDYAATKLKVFYAEYSAVADGVLMEYPDATGLTATFTLIVITV
jgi:hypothetical protein